MLKRVMLLGVAIGALTAGAEAADFGRPEYNPITAKPVAQQMSADVRLYGGWTRISPDSGSDYSAVSIGGYARLNYWLNPEMTLQLDAFGEGVHEDDYDFGTVDIAAHLSWRSPGHLFGVMGSIGHNSDYGGIFATGALEALGYWGALQLYGQLGVAGAVSCTGSCPNAVYVHGEARYFLNPDLMLAGNLGYAAVGNGFSDAVRWGATLDYKFAGSPFGIFLAYQGRHTPSSGNRNENTFQIGFRAHINNNNLQSAAQAGATLHNFSPFTGINYTRDF